MIIVITSSSVVQIPILIDSISNLNTYTQPALNLYNMIVILYFLTQIDNSVCVLRGKRFNSAKRRQVFGRFYPIV